ncbi:MULTISPECIES: AzlC family ABC transporter permease [Variovorax]|jgi:predicted branched-subunit amino acid permease|uniref:AzlC family ABC transporter permease n=1 Tax=Variovorax TaxID=34072 RepID=UPI00086B8995|nr:MULTISPECIES: AzlC family ABC transporter permease [Variovorax]MBN8755079.1 AzlC family ABC transporter permease [Variovorax sp.]ODU14889.1 MAG: branched-chain amino acid ABC transporter permease [Variovorax sp. SCN 67-85]ODV26223.1 MAG: branched-chain amino acid ABC transporter permease [Variovorax sp. SCN 67-20]OJZ03733.1 MAG: branched-chain amino acid ABC transporter permease [Variovorax sp. 67-131]UKI07437.1 AzlC family ABC transporter permease [Variovorax paradoxus]
MFLSTAIRSRPEFRAGVRDMSSVALGIGAWGLMTGVAMVKSDMSVIEAVAMTLLVYAGSSQLAAIPLLAAGAPAWVILATGFCVNLRFVVFSLHLRPYLMHMPRWRRMLHGYLTADMSYALFTKKYQKPPLTIAEQQSQEAYLTGNYFVTWCAWMGMSMLGVALANFIPQSWGLGFAGVLSLVAIVCSMATTRLRVLAALIAGATAVAAYALPLKLNIVVAIGVAVLLCFWLEKQFGLDPTAEDDK